MRRFMNLSRAVFVPRAAVNLALVAMLGTPLAACGKKDPAPPPATLADTAVENTPKAEPEKTPEPQPVPVPEPAKPAPTAQTAPPPADRPALSTASLETIPEDFVAVAGTANFAELFKTISKFAAAHGLPVPDNALEAFIAAAKQETGIDLSWVDTDKPFRFTVPDPKAHQNGFLLLLAIKADAKLEPSAFPKATAGTDGHWAKVDLQGRDAWLDIVDGHLVVASDTNFIKNDAFVKALIGWTPSSPLVLDTSVANLRKTFAQELSEARQMAQMLAGMANDPKNPGESGQLKKMVDFGFAVVDGLDRMGFALDPSSDFPRLAVTLTGAQDSPIGKLAVETKDRKAALATATPADAWFAMGYDIPGAGYISNIGSPEQLVEQLTSQSDNPVAPKLTAAEKAEFAAKLTRLIELQGSQSATWIREIDGLPFIFEGLSDSPDASALASSLIDVGNFLFAKVWVQMRQQMIAQGMPADQIPNTESFSDFASFFNKNAGMLGINLATAEVTSDKGVKGHGLEVAINWAKLPVRAPSIALAGQLLGNKLGFGFAGHEKLFGAVFGADAAKRAADIVGQGAASTDDVWLNRAAQKPIYAIVRPTRIANVLTTHVPALKDAKSQLEKIADDPIVLTGSSDGKTISFELLFSVQHIELFSILVNTSQTAPTP